MANDLHQLSFEQLQDLIDRAEARMKVARKEHLVEAKRKIQAVLAQHGVSLEEVFPKRGVGSAGAKPPRPAKYRNPAQPEETWSGMGRKPLWLVEALKHRGVTLDQFLIKGAATTKKRGRPRANA